mgnify:CR=1 FL=1
MLGFIGFLTLIVIGVVLFYKIKGNHIASELCDDVKDLSHKVVDDVIKGTKNAYDVIKNKSHKEDV